MARKNQARLQYKGQNFLVWQDDNLNWCYSLSDLVVVSTSSKELQTALNMAHETIDEKAGRKPQPKGKKPVGLRHR